MDPAKPHIAYVMVADLYGEINPGTSFSENSDLGNAIALGLTRGEWHIFRGIVDGLGNEKELLKGRRTIEGKKILDDVQEGERYRITLGSLCSPSQLNHDGPSLNPPNKLCNLHSS